MFLSYLSASVLAFGGDSTYELARATRAGEKRTWLCGLFQYLNMYGTAIAYTITTATCLRYGTVPYVRTPLSSFDLLAMLDGNGDTRYYCRRAIVISCWLRRSVSQRLSRAR